MKFCKILNFITLDFINTGTIVVNVHFELIERPHKLISTILRVCNFIHEKFDQNFYAKFDEKFVEKAKNLTGSTLEIQIKMP